MTATVNFEAPQLKVDNGKAGIEISQVILPYSIRNAEDSSQYLGGQTVLTQEDGIALTDNTADWYKKALVKIKDMVSATELYNPDVVTEEETETVDDFKPDEASGTLNTEVTPDVSGVNTEQETPDNVTEVVPAER